MGTKFAPAVRDSGSTRESSHVIHSEFTHVRTFGVEWSFGVDDKIAGWASFPTRAQAFARARFKETV
jgi:hypothetical protein